MKKKILIHIRGELSWNSTTFFLSSNLELNCRSLVNEDSFMVQTSKFKNRFRTFKLH